MGKRGKRYREGATQVDRLTLYELDEGVQLLKKTASAKFKETVDLAVHLGVDPRHADQNIRGTVALPHGTGQEVRVVVFAQGDKAREAEEAGADEVGVDDLVEKIVDGWMDFDATVATPDDAVNHAEVGAHSRTERLNAQCKGRDCHDGCGRGDS